MADIVLYVASYGKGIGTGHVARACRYVRAFADAGLPAFVLPVDLSKRGFSFASGADLDFFSGYYGLDRDFFLSDLPDRLLFSLVDLRFFSSSLLNSLKERGFVLALDPDYRTSLVSDISVASFPVMHGGRINSYFCPVSDKDRFLSFSKLKKEESSILVTMGGEDPYRLTEWLQKMVLPDERLSGYKVRIVKGPAFKRDIVSHWGEEIVEPDMSGFYSLLGRSEIVITSYGLTAYEAVLSGAAVWLFCPTSYHYKLAKKAGFYAARPYGYAVDSFFMWLDKKADARECSAFYDFVSRKGLPEIVYGFYEFLGSDFGCPACSSPRRIVVDSFSTRSFLRCLDCGTEYELVFSGGAKEYGKEYFFEEYRAQYGKTYLEDFDNIKAMGKERIRYISSCIGNVDAAPVSLLDVGCAYGPFLSAASDEGFLPFGLDVSEDAVRYVRDVLGFSAWCSDFSALSAGDWVKKSWDVVTMWYVIEHFKSLESALRLVSDIVRPGGVFAFSTPNARGLSRFFNKKGFYDSSPSDHYVLLYPSCVRRVLRRYGFCVRYIRSTGVHPERIPLIGSFIAKNRFLMSVFSFFIKLFGLGDTFEVYAVKS